MGACGSAPQSAESKSVDRQLAKEKKADEDIIKMLLLGAGESGKSTVFKQMKQIYGAGYKVKDCVDMRPAIVQNVVSGCQICIEASRTLEGAKSIGNESCGDADAEDMTNVDNAAAKIMQNKNINDLRSLDESWNQAVITVGSTPEYEAVMLRREEMQLFTSFEEYMGNVLNKTMGAGEPSNPCPDPSNTHTNDGADALWGSKYWVPNEKDIMNARVRTSGIVEEKFEIEGANVAIFDVGGQRNERRKWIHFFDNVTAVVFVAAASAYDEVLFEDATTNRMKESLELFDQICQTKYFFQTSMILFLNKEDLLDIKYRDKSKFAPANVPLFDDCPSYFKDAPASKEDRDKCLGLCVGYNESRTIPGWVEQNAKALGLDPKALTVPHTVEYNGEPTIRTWMLTKFVNTFEAANAKGMEMPGAQKPNRRLYTHFTCATNKNNVNMVMNSIIDIVTSQNIAENFGGDDDEYD